ncbi:hypothetical protein [Blattabacterium cuenoti]|uniref:hypothetical protein n=1 Tax=Blattabacterium cuenoti TaxID=1653831 RepID=UPI0031200AC9
MKKIFIFIFLLFSILFFSSCHDEGLYGIIDKSEIKTKTVVTDENQKPTASKSYTFQSSDEDEEEQPTTSRLEEMMRKDPNFKKVIEILNSTSGIVPTPVF